MGFKEESTATATAGLNLLANLLGASAKTDAVGDTGGAKSVGVGRDHFKINLFPDDALDNAQAKGDCDEVCVLLLLVGL